ncbi:hypothetical protein CIB84_014173 [Bambusicola thoracicus]|uniref:RING-type E3 ubiquitin transferase n=1 Tax=Bambusicola thoracicus TaxID=9083 RepID=A0A2P4SDB7_BAMTH|nr:hypothetical protein CIB84_014173 [Bambusicola thoracicus]
MLKMTYLGLQKTSLFPTLITAPSVLLKALLTQRNGISMHDKGSSSDSTVLAVFPDEMNSHELEHGSSEHWVDQFPWNDETPGSSYSPSEEHGATIIYSSELESSYEDTAWERLTLQFQLQSSVDSSDSNSSSDYHDIAGYVNLYAERMPELVELSSDSEESVREKKREDVKKEQSIQDSSWSDRELSRASSPHSSLYKEHMSICQSTLLSVVKRTVSMDEQKNKDKIKDHSPLDSDWSLSPGMGNVCSPCSQRLFRKKRTRSPQNSEGSHGHQPWRKHHSEHQFKRDYQKAEIVANIRAKEAGGQGPVT